MKFKSAIFLILLSFFAYSCEKEQGCTDPEALNYNPDAQEDDGSCRTEEDIKEDIKKETDPEVINFTVNWGTSSTTESYYDLPDLDDQAVIVYVDWDHEEWIPLPIYDDYFDHYYVYKESGVIELHFEDSNGNNPLNDPQELKYRVVLIQDNYAESNPQIKTQPYEKTKEELDL